MVRIAVYAGKDAQKFGRPLMQCAVVKSFSGVTRNESVPPTRFLLKGDQCPK